MFDHTLTQMKHTLMQMTANAGILKHGKTAEATLLSDFT